MTPRRHLLVVATQCRSQRELFQLDGAANRLEALLTDDTIGACQPSLRDGRAIVTGDKLVADDIYALVRQAIGYAAEQGAVLVLAFLGHGFVPGQDPTLHYMAPNSTIDNRTTAVNVQVLLQEAIDQPGIDGVIALVDTCHAAGAAVGRAAVVAGALRGQVRYQLLMAAAVDQEAFDLRLSTTTADLLDTGLADEHEMLTAWSLVETLRKRIRSQDTVFDHHDGATQTNGPLWMARNRAHAILRGSTRDGLPWQPDLPDLVAALGLPRALGEDQSPAGLRELRRQLPTTGLGTRAHSIVDSLVVAHETARLLDASVRRINSTVLRRTLKYAEIPQDDTAPIDNERALLVHLARRYPALDGTCRRQMTRFIVALVTDQGEEADWARVDEWADRIGARVLVNNAREDLHGRALTDRLRLIVSLHAGDPTAVWPTTVMAWLVDDSHLIGPEQKNCRADAENVEGTVGLLIDWGSAEARRLGIKLRNVEIAATTGLLAEGWQPETIKYHRRLGDQYLVTVRWSERLRPSPSMARSIDYAATQLQDIVRSEIVPPVDWLDEQDIDDPVRLSERLVDGVFDQAIGLTRNPRKAAEAMGLVLAHSPIVLWPHTLDEISPKCRACVAEFWHRLPSAFRELYRQRWRGQPTDDLAELRAIWDDERWLEFCNRFQRMPRPTAKEHTP